MTGAVVQVSRTRLDELTALEEAVLKALDKGGETIEGLGPQLQRYTTAGEMPSKLATQVTAVFTVLGTLTSVSLGKAAAQTHLWGPLEAQARANGTLTDPFIEARDAQLEASSGRHLIESHLNSLSQGGIEQLAQALREGGRLEVRVRR